MGIEIPSKYLKEMISEADIDKDNEISFEEFVLAMKKKIWFAYVIYRNII